ncbi:MAG: methylmalonyl-CoA epimerase [Cellvibrionaceae bacterium]|nr:methylmalonyl-CoA epimerase [Cellvibrionaceae bacterium]
MLVALDHIAIAVPDFNKALQRFVDDFGLTLEACEEVVAAQTRTAFLPVPSTRIELLHPLNGGGPIAKYLDKRGGGMHHLCFRSDNLEEDIARLRAKGYHFLSDQPQRGAHGCRVIFIHPTSCDGVLIELSQPPNTDRVTQQ